LSLGDLVDHSGQKTKMIVPGMFVVSVQIWRPGSPSFSVAVICSGCRSTRDGLKREAHSRQCEVIGFATIHSLQRGYFRPTVRGASAQPKPYERRINCKDQQPQTSDDSERPKACQGRQGRESVARWFVIVGLGVTGARRRRAGRDKPCPYNLARQCSSSRQRCRGRACPCPPRARRARVTLHYSASRRRKRRFRGGSGRTSSETLKTCRDGSSMAESIPVM
jgi:hypothetical protein